MNNKKDLNSKLENARKILNKYHTSSISLVYELINERRMEVKKEIE